MTEPKRFPWEVTIIVIVNILMAGIYWGLLSASVDNLKAEIISLKNTLKTEVVMREENNLWRLRYEERHMDLEKRVTALEQHKQSKMP